MPDRILVIVFGTVTAIGLVVGAVGVILAVRTARKKEGGELMMAFWSMIALAGLTVSGMCAAYFLIPILVAHLTH